MIRIWKGPEKEGFDLDEMTLFICSNEKLNLDNLIEIINNNNDIVKIYLGAGRQKFKGFTTQKDDIKFKAYCKSHNLKLTIETEFENLKYLIDYLNYAEIVLTIRTTYFKINDVKDIKLKLDDYDTARIYDNVIYFDTDLLDVSDNRYSCDEIIYEEE